MNSRRFAIWSSCLVLLTLQAALRADDYQGDDPYQPQQDHYRTQLLIVGGSSGGTAAAITAGRLGIDTIWTLRAPRDLGGLSTNAINPDSDLPIRYIGGLALEYDILARYRSDYHVGGQGNGEGYFAPFHHLFRYTREQIDALPSVKVLSQLYPLAVEKDPHTRRITRVVFGHRQQPQRRIVIEPQITIDAEIEGDVAFLAGAEMTLRREASVASDDPTRDRESYAGKIYTPQRTVAAFTISGGKLMEGSTQQADDRAATMAYNGSLSLQDYRQGTAESPWVLQTPPANYDPAEFSWWNGSVCGVYLGQNHRRWNMDPLLSTVEGWRLADGRHVLESMDLSDRETNEKDHLAHQLRALWHLQHHLKQYRYGLSEFDFREGLAAKYRLSDFGTRTRAGNQPLPGLIYMREGRRLVNDHVFGGKLIEDDHSGRFVQKRYWHPRAAYFNAMLVDIHGVHLQRNAGSGPEGMQLLRLAGHHDFGAPCIPFDVFVPRPREVTGLLVAAAGAYTHQAYAAFPRMETGRIAQGHACALAAYHALQDKLPVHEVDVRKVQISNLQLHGQSLVYLDDTIPGTRAQLVDQMLAARRVPERNDQGVYQREDQISSADARKFIERLFVDYADAPFPAEDVSAALVLLDGADEAPLTRAQAINALTTAAGIAAQSSPTEPLFVDVPTDSKLASQLAVWKTRRWITTNSEHKFEPEAPLPFHEFKQHAYHVLFGSVAPKTVAPVDYRTWHAHDTFNRADQPVNKLASGAPVRGNGQWRVERGQLRGAAQGTTYLLVDCGSPDADVSVDLFLEQSSQLAAAGLVVRAQDEQNMQRFLLDTDGSQVRLRIDTLVAGERTTEWIEPRTTHRRGFTLRLVAQGPQLTYYLDGEQVYQQQNTQFAGATQVGVLSGGAVPSRLDNFAARAVR